MGTSSLYDYEIWPRFFVVHIVTRPAKGSPLMPVCHYEVWPIKLF